MRARLARQGQCWRSMRGLLCIGALLSGIIAPMTDARAANEAVLTRTLLQSHPIDGTNQELREYLLTFPPGFVGKVHHHPVVSMGYILDGTAESQFDGQDLKTYHSGDSFQEPAVVKHVVFRNPDHGNPLRLVIFYQVDRGAPVIEADAQ